MITIIDRIAHPCACLLVLSRPCCETVIKLASMLALSTIKPSFFPLLSLPAADAVTLVLWWWWRRRTHIVPSPNKKIWLPYWTCQSSMDSKGKVSFKKSALAFKRLFFMNSL